MPPQGKGNHHLIEKAVLLKVRGRHQKEEGRCIEHENQWQSGSEKKEPHAAGKKGNAKKIGPPPPTADYIIRKSQYVLIFPV